jgi:hypothetical protein
MQSFFKINPPNLKQHNGIVDNLHNIFKIDYAPYLNRWFSRRILSLDSSIDKELVLINLYDIESKTTYEWCRPDLQPIIEADNLRIIDQLLREDILNYLHPELKAV